MPTPTRLQIKVIKDLVRDADDMAGDVADDAASEPTLSVLRAAFLPLNVYARIDIPLPAGGDPQLSNERLGLQLSGWPDAGNPACDFVAAAGLPPPPPAPASARAGRRRRMLVMVSCPEAPLGRFRFALVRAGRILTETRLARRVERVRVLTPRRPAPAPGHPPSGQPASGQPAQAVLISGTAKSGTTWVEKIVNAHRECLVMHEANTLRLIEGSAIAQDLDSKRDAFRARHIPWLPAEFSAGDFAAFLQMRLARELMNYLGEAWGARFVADRTPGYCDLYMHLYGFWEDVRVLHIVRHPLDVITSWIFHEASAARDPARPTKIPRGVLDAINAALDRGATPDAGGYVPDAAIAAGALRFFVDAWRRDQASLRRAVEDNPEQFHVVRYEDLVTDFEATARGLFGFLGIAPSAPDLARIREEASFHALSGGRQPGVTDQRSFFRRGVSGDWRNVLSAAQAALIWPDLAEMAAAFGYERPT